MATTPTTLLPYSLDDYFKTTPIGSISSALANNSYGINHMQIPGAVQSNRDMYGYTFFVRPQLNMQAENIRGVRQLLALLNTDPMSVQRYVRTTLDPRLMVGFKAGNTTQVPISSPLTDTFNPFISLLTNNLQTLSGWPDMTAQTFTSKSGVYNEVYSQVDGIVKNYGEFKLTATFRNTRCHSILYMFYVWLT